MYENYKGGQNKYKNELERILAEDCAITSDFVDPEKKKWRTSEMIDRERTEKQIRARNKKTEAESNAAASRLDEPSIAKSSTR